MTINQEIILAIDTAFEQGRVVVFSRDGTILSDYPLDDKMSHSISLFHAIETCVRSLNGLSIDAVMVGLGPGSFIGLRIALATALGYSFGHSLPLLGFSSHRALAHFSLEHPKLAVITKASGNLVYISIFQRNNLIISSESCLVIDKNEIIKHLSKHTTSSNPLLDFYIITDVDIPESNLKVRGPTAAAIVNTCCEKLQLGIIDESAYIKPNYIKSPSVSIPKNSPICGQLSPIARTELDFSKNLP